MKMRNSSATETPPTVEISHVWKIFGAQTTTAMRAIQLENISKKEVLARFNCVVGVQDATFSVGEGEVFCIMGLSGSGKSTLVRHINRLLEPTAGEIIIQGEDVMSKDAR